MQEKKMIQSTLTKLRVQDKNGASIQDIQLVHHKPPFGMLIRP